MPTDYVFIHGGLRGGWCWTPTLEAMADQGHPRLDRMIAPDMPGHGDYKDASPEDCTIGGYVQTAVDAILEHDLRNIVMVGHSFAGLTMPYIAQRLPDRMRRVMFMACVVPPEGDSLDDLLAAMGKSTPEGVKDRETRWAREWDLERSAKRLGSRERAQWLLENLNKENAKQLPRPSGEKIYRDGFAGLVPLTWVLTVRDRAFLPRWQLKFREWLGGDEVGLEELDAAHDAMISQPRALA
ncbi:MAG: alpha/beta fold hydrolase, partial [Dehalococcoidia bacterium]